MMDSEEKAKVESTMKCEAMMKRDGSVGPKLAGAPTQARFSTSDSIEA